MKKRLMAWLLACLVGLSQEGAKAGGDDAAPATPLPVARIGPSFACPTPGDPLGRLVCENPSLARSDLTFVQAYQALRQASSPQQQALLRNEATAFGRAVRTRCGLLPPAAAIPPAASQCVAAAYEQQRAGWVARLAGAAAQEAGRAIDEQILLQRDLQVIGLLAPTEPINGV